MSSTEVLIEKGILSSEDSHCTYEETHYNASSNEENGSCTTEKGLIKKWATTRFLNDI